MTHIAGTGAIAIGDVDRRVRAVTGVSVPGRRRAFLCAVSATGARCGEE
jgi:hypothetical protein